MKPNANGQKFYKVLFKEHESRGVGYAVGIDGLFFLPDSGVVENWQPLVLQLRDGGFPDYLASDLGCRMCSERLKTILDRNAASSDVTQWLDATVIMYGEERRYYILHFPQPPDILDKTKSIFAGSFVVKPVLSADLAGPHCVFGYPNCGKLPLIVCERAKRAILASGCSGIEFSKVPTA